MQFVFNKAGVNPAASGTNINQKIYFVSGVTRQWIKLDRPPKQTFANFSYTIRPPRSYSYWQNIGGMVERDESGVMSYNAAYINYTIHLVLRKNLVASFGVYAGLRQFFIAPGILDPNDPIAAKTVYKTLAYPDIIPGLRLSNKKFFLDIATKQVSIFSIQNYKNSQIGGPSRLNPTLFIAYGKVFPVNDYCVFLPSVSLNNAIIGVPSISTNLILYYANRFGFGLSTRNLSLLGTIVQARLWENLSVGLSYSYSINYLNSAAPHSYEIMIGMVPMGMDGKYKGGRSVDRCPALDY